MDNPPKPLPSAGSIISESWKLFTTTWNTSVKTSILFLYVGIAYFASSLLVTRYPSLGPLDLVISFGGIIFTIWISLRVSLTMLNLEAGKQPHASVEESKFAWSLFAPLLWVGLLNILVVLGASLVFLLPGIYFATALSFADIILLDQNTRGTQALAASRALVNGRWWGTLWRLFAGGIVFGSLVGVAVGILIGLASVMAGPGLMSGGKGNDLVFGITQFVQQVVFAALMPLLAGFKIKVYRMLQRTR